MFKKIGPYIQQAGPLALVILLANLVNFVFNAFLAHALPVGDYGFLALINTFWTVLLVLAGALLQVVSFQVAKLAKNPLKGYEFYVATSRQFGRGAAILGLIWLAASPWLAGFFRTTNVFGIAIFAPMIALGLQAGIHRGYVQGRLKLSQIGTLFLIEAASKLVFAASLVAAGLSHQAYLSLPLSVGVAWISSRLAAKRLARPHTGTAPQIPVFPWKFLAGNLVAGLAAMAFLSTDLLLAKHYLSPTVAGHYALLSLVGKMVFFFGSMPMMFMLTMLGAAEGTGENPRRVYWRMYAFTVVLALGGFIALGPLGGFIVPLLFGANTHEILPELGKYSLGIALFTLANATITYHLARKNYRFSFISIGFAVAMGLTIIFRHAGIAPIASSVWLAGLGCFIVISAADLLIRPNVNIHTLQELGNQLFRRGITKPKHHAGKRILILNWRDTKHAQAGGAEIYIHELAKRWHISGHEITLFCGNDGRSPRNETIDGIRIIRRGNFVTAYLWAAAYYAVYFRGKFDVIVDSHNGIPFFSPLYARIPIYCVVHHVHQDVFTRYLNKPMAYLATFLEKIAMPYVYRNCQFMTVSKSSKQAMSDRLGIDSSHIRIIPNGIDLNQFVPGPKATIPMVLYVGRLKAYKSVDVLLKAFALVTEQNPRARLVIAGTGDALPDLQALSAKLGLDDKITFLGHITNTEKIELLQQAWVFVSPSYAEGWGITIIEANACGTPVVASDVPGLRDSVNSPSSGYLVEYGNVHGFATKISLILGNQEKRQQLSANAGRWASKFDWQTSANSFLEVIS